MLRESKMVTVKEDKKQTKWITDGTWRNKKEDEAREKDILYSRLLPKRISFYFGEKGGPQRQSKLTQVLLFSHYEIEGRMRRD